MAVDGINGSGGTQAPGQIGGGSKITLKKGDVSITIEGQAANDLLGGGDKKANPFAGQADAKKFLGGEQPGGEDEGGSPFGMNAKA